MIINLLCFNKINLNKKIALSIHRKKNIFDTLTHPPKRDSAALVMRRLYSPVTLYAFLGKLRKIREKLQKSKIKWRRLYSMCISIRHNRAMRRSMKWRVCTIKSSDLRGSERVFNYLIIILINQFIENRFKLFAVDLSTNFINMFY